MHRAVEKTKRRKVPESITFPAPPENNSTPVTVVVRSLFVHHPLASTLLDFLLHCIGCKIELAWPCDRATLYLNLRN